jgi:hypothetical protein
MLENIVNMKIKKKKRQSVWLEKTLKRNKHLMHAFALAFGVRVLLIASTRQGVTNAADLRCRPFEPPKTGA